MALSVATQKVRMPTGTIIRFSGQGNNGADAEAELAAKLALTVGVPIVGSHKLSQTQITENPLYLPDGAFEDVVFTLVRAGIYSTWRVENVSAAFASVERPGYVDPTNALILAAVAAHTDFAGNKGFSLVEGKYMP